MIGEEMRELISAYVDGEVKAAEAARLEELARRDPDLRGEIEAYRRLSEELRALDRDSAGAAPSPALKAGVLERARRYDEESRALRVRRLGPLALAASLLLAAAAGIWLGGRETELVRIAAGGASGEPAPFAPFPEFVYEPVVLPPGPAASGGAGEAWTVAAAVEKALDTFRFERPRPAPEPGEVYVRETSTAPPADRGLLAVVGTFAPRGALSEGFSILARRDSAAVAATEPLPVQQRVGLDVASDADSLAVTASQPSLMLLGEILVAADRSGRTRLIASDAFVEATQIVPMAWADDVATPDDAGRLVLQEWIAGPLVRRRLAGASGRDPLFAASLGERRLHDRLRETATSRRKEIETLRRALAEDPEATGFAVFVEGNLLGAEVFSTHALLEKFAPRLLPGYFADAPGPIDLRPLSGAEARSLGAFRSVLESLPASGAKVVENGRGSRDGWPEGLRVVDLRAPSGALVGHGLLQGDTPLHLTLWR